MQANLESMLTWGILLRTADVLGHRRDKCPTYAAIAVGEGLCGLEQDMGVEVDEEGSDGVLVGVGHM